MVQNDAYLLFKALTTLSMKKLPENKDDVAVRSKALALELLLSVIEKSGPLFRSHPRFLALIKDKLVRSLTQNCVSPIEPVYKMAAPMFTALVERFKPQLKHEIGVILNNIFLSMIKSPMSSYMQKSTAIVILTKLCKDPQTLVELFLNFDCDVECEDKIFELIVTQLEKVAQGRFMSESLMSPQNEATLRLRALEALGAIITSLARWCDRLRTREGARQRRQGGGKDGKDKDGKDDEDPASASQSETDVRDSRTKSAFVSNYIAQKDRREMLSKAVLLFNRKPKRGVKFAIENKIVDGKPESVARFLLNTPKLNKDMIGEYLGEEDKFNLDVLYRLIESYDFQGFTFDGALRHILKDFRLPGEGQKIDRIMVKFADQYTTHNPHDKGGTFRTADGAYVLAYSTIMLHTNLHNPKVKPKMSKEQFFNMNRGIDDGQDIDQEFLSNLYDRIQAEEIKMTGSDGAPSDWQSASNMNSQKREWMFRKETENILKSTEEQIKRRGGKSKAGAAASAGANGRPGAKGASGGVGENVHQNGSVAVGDASEQWYAASRIDLASLQPMFDILWCPAFATFSLVLKENGEPRVARLCLNNYRSAVHLSSLFGMDTPRDAFVKSLQYFSLLGTAKPLAFKNVEALKTLLDIANTEGDYLEESWTTVLQCVSEFEKLLRGTASRGAPAPVDVFGETDEAKARASRRSVSKDQAILQSNADMLREQLDPALVDRVFTQSAQLSSDAIVHFVRSLTQVSKAEVFATRETPRVFCLQKIVEITYYNMNRIRLVWTRIWTVLSAYFAEAGCHPNLKVSLYSIDSLRQLAMKFLEKDELLHYHFQKQFLQPFELIMANTKADESKALIVQCISRMVSGRVANVRSGWKCVFVVLRIAASDPHPQLVKAAFALMERIMQNYFSLVTRTLHACVATLVGFANNGIPQISLKSIDYLAKCAGHLAAAEDAATTDTKQSAQKVSQPAGLSRQSSDGAAPASSFTTWSTLLGGCKRLALDARAPLRERALKVLLESLGRHGRVFTVENWRFIFRRIMFPMFDGVRRQAVAAPPAKARPPAVPSTTPSATGTKPQASRTRPQRSPQPPTGPRPTPGAAAAGSGGAGSAAGAVTAKPPRRVRATTPSSRDSGRDSGSMSSSSAAVGVNGASPAEWLKTTCPAAMQGLVALFCQYFTTIKPLLGDVLELIGSCIAQPNVALANVAIANWESLLNTCGSKLTQGEWAKTLAALQVLLDAVLPHELQTPRLRAKLGLEPKQPHPAPQGAADSKRTGTDVLVRSRAINKCRIHRALSEAAFRVFDKQYESFQQEHVQLVLSAFEASVGFMAGFNTDTELRDKLFQAGFRDKTGAIFGLVDQEVGSLQLYLKALQKLYAGTNSNFDDTKMAEGALRRTGVRIFQRYAAQTRGGSGGDDKKLSAIVCTLIDGFCEYDEAKLRLNMPTFFPWVLNLVEAGGPAVRASVAAFLRKQIQPLLPFAADDQKSK